MCKRDSTAQSTTWLYSDSTRHGTARHTPYATSFLSIIPNHVLLYFKVEFSKWSIFTTILFIISRWRDLPNTKSATIVDDRYIRIRLGNRSTRCSYHRAVVPFGEQLPRPRRRRCSSGGWQTFPKLPPPPSSFSPTTTTTIPTTTTYTSSTSTATSIFSSLFTFVAPTSSFISLFLLHPPTNSFQPILLFNLRFC